MHTFNWIILIGGTVLFILTVLAIHDHYRKPPHGKQ